ncbi:(2Fe-2S)-binding protein [Streptomyces endophyticus]|uniref:(2Fe-2S)-binding protein n=1 Tax=Streptomyces endophyticus TaxID=714166 RepID=A0ABU6FAA0_9ACTN|nr:(2Fe-2S)-binding protein [Streptomyces endophyticus]MEB8340260.1 (2Fe-2S)-binding protein [Streptomyces endophyticus]
MSTQDPLLCLCSRVPESEVVAAVAAGACDVATVSVLTEAGTGCGDCLVDIEEVLAERPSAATHRTASAC